jgi:hypothetical protein
VFNPEICIDPEGEYLVLEIPYMHEEEEKGPPVLSEGHVFVPDGATNIDLTIFIKVVGCFAYTFERGDIVYHGSCTAQEKKEIEERCRLQQIPFLEVTPKDRLWSAVGVNVVPCNSAVYEKIFDGMVYDPQQIFEYLQKTSSTVDEERGTHQANLGSASKMNYQCQSKTREELDLHPMDFPSWSGKKKDFDVLSPLIRDPLDRLQCLVDYLYRGTDRQQTCQIRLEQFAELLNQRLGCTDNRFEAITIAIAMLDPRTFALLRHLDRWNDLRKGYQVTAIHSVCLRALDLQGNPVAFRVSLIAYNRNHAGDYHDRTISYVGTYRSRIANLLSVGHYSRVNEYHNLNLCEEYSKGHTQTESVYRNGKEIGTLKCLVLPSCFDPCAYLSVFAWCIGRLRVKLQLKTTDVVELVCVACMEDSPLPFVWFTEQVCREIIIDSRTNLVEKGISEWYCKLTMQGDICIPEREKTIPMLEELIALTSDPISELSTKQALERMTREIPGMNERNRLKVFPLSALVGLFDIRKCFGKVLCGECPSTEPHAKELKRMGCGTVLHQRKYTQGLNEWLGTPREFFLHGDQVLRMAQKLVDAPQTREWQMFFVEMPLYRFFQDDHSRTLCVQVKWYGQKVWEKIETHVWEDP